MFLFTEGMDTKQKIKKEVGGNIVKKTPNKLTQIPDIAYKKLVVPVSMRSIYWKFFGFPATETGEVISKLKIVCTLCRTQMVYNRNTSNLRTHLRCKHAAELSKIESFPLITPIKKKKPMKTYVTQSVHHELNNDGRVNDDDEMDEDGAVHIEVQNDLADKVTYVVSEDLCLLNDEFDKVTEAITKHVTLDLAPPEVVHSTGFLKLMVSLLSPCRVPGLEQLTHDILPKMYFKLKNHVIEEMSRVQDHFSLTVEEWSTNGYRSYVSFCVYYNDEDCLLQHRMLATLPLTSNYTQAAWCDMINIVLDTFNIHKDRVSAVVYATQCDQLLSALKINGFTVIPCIDFIIQNCASSCFDNEEVKEILTKIRSFIWMLSLNKEAGTIMREQEIANDLESNAFKQDNEYVWLTTYTMLENACSRRYIIQHILENNCDINERQAVELTESQWDVLQDVKVVLEPFKVTTQTLSEERVSLISILKPLLWQLTTTKLQIEEDDSVTSSSLKHGLSDLLTYKYYTDEISYFLDTTSWLDPRFKVLPYITETTKNKIRDSIKKQLISTIKKTDPDVKEKKKESRVSGISLLLGNIRGKAPETPEQQAENEYTQYLGDVSAPLDSCPIQWWSKFSFKYPTLNQLASKYMCIPSFATLPGKITEEARLTYHLKRSAINPELVDKMLFLHVNQGEG